MQEVHLKYYCPVKEISKTIIVTRIEKKIVKECWKVNYKGEKKKADYQFR